MFTCWPGVMYQNKGRGIYLTVRLRCNGHYKEIPRSNEGQYITVNRFNISFTTMEMLNLTISQGNIGEGEI